MSLFGRRHSGLDGNDVGTIVWKEVADAAARLAIILTEDKEGRVVKQIDNGSFWILDDYATPTWRELTSVGVAAVTSVAGRIGDVVLSASDIADLPAEVGDVAKSGSTTANQLTRWVGTGSTVKGSPGATVTDTGDLTLSGDIECREIVFTVGISGGTTGDLSVRDGEILGDLEVGGDIVLSSGRFRGEVASEVAPQGYVLTSDGNDGSSFEPATGGGGGSVDSIFGRQGVVLAQPSDYAASEIDNDSTASGAFVDDALTNLQSLVGTAQSTANAAASDATNAKTKTDRITVTQAVNLDTMESDGVTNNAKISYTDAATVAASAAKLTNVTTISTFGAALIDDASVAAQRTTLGLGTAAVLAAGSSIGNLPVLENVGGNPGLPAVDGSQLTGLPGGTGSAITVQDDLTTYTTDVTLFKFSGGGVTVTEPTPDQITITIAPGASPIDTVFGRTGAVVAANGDYTASQVANVPSGTTSSVTVQAAINEIAGDVSTHTHDTLANIDGGTGGINGRIVGRTTAGSGLSEELTATQVRSMINVENGATADQTAGEIEAIVNHDNLIGFVANEHIDWTGDAGASNIHVNNITAVPQAAVTAHVAAINHNSLLNYLANQHIDWTADAGASNIHVNNLPAATTSAIGAVELATDGESAANVAVQGNDSRLSNDRTASGIRTATGVVSVSAAAAPTTGQILKATGATTATWQDDTGGAGSFDLADINPASGTVEDLSQALTNGSINGAFLGEIVRVTDNAADGEYLKYTTAGGVNWAAGGGGAAALTDLTDVTLTTPATDAVLIKSAGDWIDGTINTNSITDAVVTNAKLANVAGFTIKAKTTTGTGALNDIAMGTNTVLGRVAGDVVAAQIVNGQITDATIAYAKIQNVSAASKILGRGSAAGAGVAQELAAAGSLTISGTDVQLSGDAASPGNSKYYGTNSGGSKGYYDLPTGGGASLTVSNAPSFYVENPVTGQSWDLFRAHRAFTVTEIEVVARGTNPSVAWLLRKSANADRSSPTTIHSATTSVTGSVATSTITTITAASVSLNDYLWVEATTVSGTTTSLMLNFQHEASAALPRSYIAKGGLAGTSSSSYAVITGTTITPALGWYRATATVARTFITNTATLTGTIGIHKNGTLITDAEGEITRGGTTTANSGGRNFVVVETIAQQTDAAHVWAIYDKTTDTSGWIDSGTSPKPTLVLVQVAEPNV